MARRGLCVLVLLAAVAPGQDTDSKKKKKPAAAPPPPAVHTTHEVNLGAASVSYTATAGTLPLLTEKGDARAHVFYVAYVKRNVTDASRRPLTFVFNGGPGSSSIWLHLGTVGPRRVVMDDDGRPLPPPGRVAPCRETWLDLTDLVFIDPVGTGFSRPAGKHKQGEFSGLKEDTESVGEFIRLYTTRHARWASPKFLAGESYGTTRAASLAGHLQRRHGMYLNGIVLVSAVLNFQTIRYGTGNDLPYALILPAFTATAWHHRRLPEDLMADRAKTLKEVETFALAEYLPALAFGDALPAARRKALAARLARYTGLDAEFFERSNLRVSQGRFCKELLRDQRRTVGRLDSRYTGVDRDAAGSGYEYDPSMAAIDGPFSAALKHYVRKDLRYESDLPYETLTGRVHPWSYKSHQNRYVDVGETLRKAMSVNRNLKVLVCSGYTDLATPYFAADYTVHHLMLDPALKGHVRVRYYDAGHMMYIHTPSRKKLKADVAEFYDWALGGAAGG